MACYTYFEETERELGWKTDLSNIKVHKSKVLPLTPIDDELADLLLQPIKGLCQTLKVDKIWLYQLCVDNFVRQELIPE